MHTTATRHFAVRLVAALLLGSLTPLALAPLNLWPLAITCPTLLALLSWRYQWRPAFWLYFAYGCGLFGCGVSWVYVSIHHFGNAPMPLAIAMTALFAGFLALIFAIIQALAHRPWLGQQPQPASLAHHFIGFCLVWVLGEWLRSWLLTGFPWLLLGYSQLSDQWQTPLLGWAPLFGVYGISLAVLASGAALVLLIASATKRMNKSRTARIVSLLLLAVLWGGGALLQINAQQKPWTHPNGNSRSVALVQPNIPQELKWRPSYLRPTLERLMALSNTPAAQQAQWVIWPEAAIPLLYHQAGGFLQQVHEQALSNQQALITGILYDSVLPQNTTLNTSSNTQASDSVYNSVIGLGMGAGVYHKTHLVPFGEYVPLEAWLRGLIDFFNLPASFIQAGPDQQHGLQIGDVRIANAICYEVAFPALVAQHSRHKDILLTVSNDAWFGHSWGPLQHLQMVQMRALETGRYVMRATNNGISAIIAPDGKIEQQTQQFVATTLVGEVVPMQGETPYINWGNWPILLLLWVSVAGWALSLRPLGQHP